MPKKKNKHLYKELKENRPSVFRMSLLNLVMWLIGNLVGLASFILGMSILIDTTVGRKLLALISDRVQAEVEDESTRNLSFFLAAVFIFLGILFWIIAYLSRRLLVRNAYIFELEELMDDEMERKIIKKAAETSPEKK